MLVLEAARAAATVEVFSDALRALLEEVAWLGLGLRLGVGVRLGLGLGAGLGLGLELLEEVAVLPLVRHRVAP